MIVIINTPLKQVLGKSDLSRRMAKWVDEINKYDVEFKPRMAIKAQALVDFIQDITRAMSDDGSLCKAYADGSVPKDRSRANVIIFCESQLVGQ